MNYQEWREYDDSYSLELLIYYRKIIIKEEYDVLLEIMQLYTDMELYSKAKVFMNIIEKHKEIKEVEIKHIASTNNSDDIILLIKQLYIYLKHLSEEKIFMQQKLSVKYKIEIRILYFYLIRGRY